MWKSAFSFYFPFLKMLTIFWLDTAILRPPVIHLRGLGPPPDGHLIICPFLHSVFSQTQEIVALDFSQQSAPRPKTRKDSDYGNHAFLYSVLCSFCFSSVSAFGLQNEESSHQFCCDVVAPWSAVSPLAVALRLHCSSPALPLWEDAWPTGRSESLDWCWPA